MCDLWIIPESMHEELRASSGEKMQLSAEKKKTQTNSNQNFTLMEVGTQEPVGGPKSRSWDDLPADCAGLWPKG